MNARVALATACIFSLFVVLLGCQPNREPAPAPQPEATAVAPTQSPVATPSPVPTNTPILPRSTLAPAPQSPTSSVPASPSPTPAPTRTPTPTVAPSPAVPPTDGPIRVEAMPSRDHFPTHMKITDVIPEGYSTVPPTSGRHWGAWSDCGFYNHPLPDELLVHNLEHGNIIVSYNLDTDAEVAALREAVEAIPLAREFAIVRRYEAIPPGMVALTTWGVLDRMQGVDAARIARFFADFPGNTGPEFANGLPCTTGVDMTQSSGS